VTSTTILTPSVKFRYAPHHTDYKASRYESEARVHMSYTSIAVTLYADVFIYKMDRCSNTTFLKKVFYANCEEFEIIIL
jgi:hypothetical protein